MKNFNIPSVATGGPCKKCGCLIYESGSGPGYGDWKQDKYKPEFGLCRSCFYFGEDGEVDFFRKTGKPG